jgi:hypothetical protein
MSSDYDATEFIDGDFEGHRSARSSSAASTGQPARAPTREQVDSELAATQQELAAILRRKEEKERERAGLEETRRRQAELHTGRQEMTQNLTRGLALLEEAEFSARRDAEQMAKALAELRAAMAKIEAINEQAWTQDNLNVELTRALTAVENARMEWNAARLKFPVLSGQAQENSAAGPVRASVDAAPLFATNSFGDLCRLGFALTWPVALVLLGLGGLLVALLHR